MVANPNAAPAVIGGNYVPMPQQPGMQAMGAPQPMLGGEMPPPYTPDGGAMMMPAPTPQAGMPPMAAGGAMTAGSQPLQIENPALFNSQSWEAKPGQTLRTLLQDWCSRVGTELHWQAEFDYPIMASMNMTGTFEEAVRTLLSGFNTAKPVPYGHLHYNPAAGQSVLIVEASGNHYGE
jgi:hypothetical protein